MNFLFKRIYTVLGVHEEKIFFKSICTVQLLRKVCLNIGAYNVLRFQSPLCLNFFKSFFSSQLSFLILHLTSLSLSFSCLLYLYLLLSLGFLFTFLSFTCLSTLSVSDSASILLKSSTDETRFHRFILGSPPIHMPKYPKHPSVRGGGREGWKLMGSVTTHSSVISAQQLTLELME